jgi:membrane protease YdiL (CAAX protease family)
MKGERRNEVAAVALTVGGLALMWLLTREVGNLWYRLAAFYLMMIPASLLAVKLEWKALFKFQGKHALYGLAAAALLYGVGWLGVWMLGEVWPESAAQLEDMYGLLADSPGWQLWPLLVFIIAGEEIVWRQAATQPFVAKFKDGAALIGAAAFTVIHIPWAPPVLWLATFVFGACWSWMAVRTKSFWAPFIAHVCWDLLIMFVAKY